jgi:hypothetical protein
MALAVMLHWLQPPLLGESVICAVHGQDRSQDVKGKHATQSLTQDGMLQFAAGLIDAKASSHACCH